MINLINQIYEIQRKTIENDINILERNVKRIYYELENMGYRVIIPLNQEYKEEYTDIEARMMSDRATTISKVIKPVIYKKENNSFVLIQKGIVIIE